MEVKNIHEHASWYTSYMHGEDQGRTLIECQTKKIKQLSELIEKISGEIELAEHPKLYDERMILDSIKALIEQTGEIEHVRGFFKWVG